MVLFTHQFCHVVESEDELIDHVFPNMQQHIFDEKWLLERNALDLSGVPPHKLELKVGVPVLLMRNLDASRLCNGTRLRITELGRHIVKATILTGEAKGDNVLIPSIPITPNNLPFNFKCLQFPLKVAFSMTINKSQGQTLKVAGIHLGSPCFSLDHLYVACSRASESQNVHVYAERKKSFNRVYRSILQ
ncbi:ATP-dependent DNA helicase [Trichonephila clavipes]|nr:ATP-dependent DNA helicase [Trichonephila clavipes]